MYYEGQEGLAKDDYGLCDGGPPGTAPECALGGEDANGNGVYDVGTETDPNNPDTDTDGDGFSDGVEAGTGPLDAQDFPIPAVPALSPTGIALLALLLGALGVRVHRLPASRLPH